MTRAGAMSLSLALALAPVLGCGEDAARAGAEAPSAPELSAPTPAGSPTLAGAPAEPTTAPEAPAPHAALDGLDDLAALDHLDHSASSSTGEGSAPVVEVTTGDAPTFGCAVTAAPVRALDRADRPAISRSSDGYLVASYVRTASGTGVAGAAGGEAVAIARLNDGRPAALLATLPVEPPVADGARRAAPALAVTSDGRLLVAATDGAGALLFAALELGSAATAGALRVLVPTAHADARFAPAIALTEGAAAVAWTDGSETPMRARLVRVDRTGAILGTALDLTPEAGGAAAPTVGRGTTTPTLFFVDPRVAISVVSRVTLSADATPSSTAVVRPLARAADPASFVVVGDGERTRIAYAAVGTSGARAVGLLNAHGSEPPVPVVPGLGFGAPISVDGAPLGEGAVLAVEAPSARDPTAPHEVRVRVLAPDGRLSEALVLGGATEPAIATGTAGDAAVATTGGYVTRLRCRIE